MATQCSFDITSNVDLQEVDNALNQARKEVAQRYDFKGAKAAIDFDAKESKLILTADDEFKLNALWEIVQTRLVRRNVPTKNLTRGSVIPAANTTVRQEITLQQGIPTEAAKEVVKFLKDTKLRKVQASIQGDQLRVTSPSKDELQEFMRLLRDKDFGVALQFGNYAGSDSLLLLLVPDHLRLALCLQLQDGGGQPVDPYVHRHRRLVDQLLVAGAAQLVLDARAAQDRLDIRAKRRRVGRRDRQVERLFELGLQ
jgi:uncharacterized protein YajQ (UPF0234 family)